MNDTRSLQRRVAAYAHAVGEALAHVPAADRESILEDLEEHIDDALRAVDELEQVLAALGTPEAYAADLAAAPAGDFVPKLCKRAAIGMLWSLSFVVVALPALLVARVVEEGVGPTAGERVFQAFAWLCLAGCLGGPVLSSIAATRIRHSGGRLSGMGMAVIGAWVPPLVVIDAFAFWALAAIVGIFAEDPKTISALQGVSLVLILLANLAFLLVQIRRERQAPPPAGLSPQPES